RRAAQQIAQQIAEGGELLARAYKSKHKCVIFGNGGSAADSQHFAAELVGRFVGERPALPCIALTVNTSTLTSVANDYAYDDVFVRQLEAFAEPGDIVIAISTSGNSPNIIRALERSRQLGAATIALTGKDGGKMRQAADL